MKELSVQAANDVNTTYDRGAIQDEINQLTSEINRIGNTTEFNTMKLLDGSKASVINGPDAIDVTKVLSTGTDFTITFQIGANTGQGMVAGISDMRSLALAISSKTAGATVDLTKIDSALVKNTGLTETGEYINEGCKAVYLAIRSVSNGSDNIDIEYALDVSDNDNATAAITIYDNAINEDKVLTAASAVKVSTSIRSFFHAQTMGRLSK